MRVKVRNCLVKFLSHILPINYIFYTSSDHSTDNFNIKCIYILALLEMPFVELPIYMRSLSSCCSFMEADSLVVLSLCGPGISSLPLCHSHPCLGIRLLPLSLESLCLLLQKEGLYHTVWTLPSAQLRAYGWDY